MTKRLHKSDFDPHLEETFVVCGETPGHLELSLVEITGKSSEQVESFSVVFRGPKEPVLQQRIYKMTHPEMGEFTLFLVPIVFGKQDGIYYQSIFNRIVEKK